MTWSASQIKHLLDRELAALRREAALVAVHTERLRECNLEAIKAADRVQEARIGALQKANDELRRLVYMGVGIAVVAATVLEMVIKR